VELRTRPFWVCETSELNDEGRRDSRKMQICGVVNVGGKATVIISNSTAHRATDKYEIRFARRSAALLLTTARRDNLRGFIARPSRDLCYKFAATCNMFRTIDQQLNT